MSKTSNSTYNGHKNFNHWNVSLWINNDESLYELATRFTTLHDVDTATVCVLAYLHGLGITHTPDGVRYTKTTIKAALRSFQKE